MATYFVQWLPSPGHETVTVCGQLSRVSVDSSQKIATCLSAVSGSSAGRGLRGGVSCSCLLPLSQDSLVGSAIFLMQIVSIVMDSIEEIK